MRLVSVMLLCFFCFNFSDSLAESPFAVAKTVMSSGGAKASSDGPFGDAKTSAKGALNVKGFAEHEIAQAIAIADIDNDTKARAAFRTMVLDAFDLDRISTFVLGKANCAILKNSGKYDEFKQVIANMLVVLNCASFKSYRKAGYTIGKISDTVAKDKDGKDVHIYEVDSTIQPKGKAAITISWTIRGYDGDLYKVFDAKVDKQVSMKTTLKHKVNDMMQKYKVSDMDGLSKKDPKIFAERLDGFMSGLKQEYK